MELALEEDAESLTTAALMLMKKYLPEYIVNCFVAAGYDTLDVIADMDVSDKPGNTLEEIATFIAKEYPGDPRFVRGTMSRSSVFPPGHRRRIASFVKHVNHLQEEKKRSSRKRRTMSSTHPPKKKRSDANTCGSSDSESSCSQFSMMGDVRQQVAKWQRQQKNSKLRELKEHDHFEVKVSMAEGGRPIASVLCKMCGRSSTLGVKCGKVLISN
jgi:hypothetical protein